VDVSSGSPPRLPDIALITLQGEPVALRDPAAAARLVILYRHDCEVCRLVLPVIERVSRAFHGQKLLTLGVSSSDADETLDCINEHGLCFPQALDADGVVAAALAAERVPTVVLADGRGDIVARCADLDAAALTDVLLAAARLSGAPEAEIRRAIAAFKLPDARPGSPLR
jgi:peroxiredoxin